MKKGSGLKAVLIVFAALVLIAGASIVTLYLMFPPQKIIALVVPQVEKAIGRKVSVENAGITLFPTLGISVNGLQVSNTERQGFSKTPFITVDRFMASISVGSIFKGYPEIQEITIKRPQLCVETDSAGAFNFDDLTPLKKGQAETAQAPLGIPALPVPITLKKFTIEEGAIVFNDRKQGNQLIIESINQQAAIAIDKQLKNITTTGNLVLSKVSVKTKEIKKPLSNLTITLSHDIGADLVDGVVTVRQVRLSLQKFFVTLKGSVSKALSPAPELDLALVSDPVAVSDLLKEVPPELFPLITKVAASGSVELGATIKGALVAGKPLPVRGELALKNVMVKYSDLPQSINNLNAAISFTDNSLNVSEMSMRLGTGPVDIKATVTNFAKPFVDASIKADIKLGEMKDVIALPPGAMVDGEIVADVKARGEADPADPAKLDLKGKVDLKNVVVVWSPLIKPATITGAFTLSSKAIGQNVAVKVGQSSLTMAATVSNYLSMVLPDVNKKTPRTNVDFKCTSPLFNLDEMLKPPEPPKEGGEQNANVPLLAPLPGIDMKGTVKAQKFVYRGFTMSTMLVSISVVNDMAQIGFTTGFAGGSIDNKLHANLKNVSNIVFTNDLTVKSIEVSDLLGRFGELIKPVTPLNRELAQINKCLSGRISLTSSLKGNGGTVDGIMKNLNGDIGLQMASGTITNAPITNLIGKSISSFIKTDKLGNFDVVNFHNLNSKITLSNGRANFNDLKMQSDIGDWNARGNVGFDALMNMIVSTKLSKAMSDNLTKYESTAKNALKNRAGGNAALGALAGMLDNVNVIPRDKDGRVSLNLGLGGIVSKPSISSIAFGQGATGSASNAAAPQQQQAQQKAQDKKQDLEQQAKKEIIKNIGKLNGIFGR